MGDAFLLELNNEADPEGGRLTGRFEHVATGIAVEFWSGLALLGFVAASLRRRGQAGREGSTLVRQR